MKSVINLKSIGTDLLIGSNICEYDIRKANISVLYDCGKIDRKLYTDLYNSDRMSRQVTIGRMQRKDYSITEALQNGICNARNIFITSNNITEDNVIRLSNDALYLHNVNISKTKISPHVEFLLKGVYTSYIKLERYKLEIFYYFNPIESVEKYKVLGLNTEELHNDYFMQLILSVFNVLESNGIVDALDMLHDFIDGYINRMFPIQFYREFNASSKYLLYSYYVDSLSEESKNIVNINYNLGVLYEIRKILLHNIL